MPSPKSDGRKGRALSVLRKDCEFGTTMAGALPATRTRLQVCAVSVETVKCVDPGAVPSKGRGS